MNDISEQDIDFVRELVNLTQAGKVSWDPGPDSTFVSRRARVSAVLSKPPGRRPNRSKVRLALTRTNEESPSQILEQRIDEAEPYPLDRALNESLAYLFQLVSDNFSLANSIYADYLEDDS